jgi:nitrite reductase/ring-hydroxylating ferredoxin subunit
MSSEGNARLDSGDDAASGVAGSHEIGSGHADGDVANRGSPRVGPAGDASSAPARWWVVALSEELNDSAPVAICCDGIEYVLFRNITGEARALRDQCAHRRAPLSLGRITADGYVECPYHGWRYDGGTGQCIAIPNLSAAEKVPRAYKTQSYKLIEQYGFIHLFTGAPELAESLQLPVRTTLVGSHEWQGSRLMAFPHESVADLLIDAPGAVLESPGLEVINDHRYGDPQLVDECVVATYAVDRTASVRGRKKAVGDYPLALEVSVATDGRMAEAQLRTDAGQVSATVVIGMYPDKPPLTSMRWRGAAQAATGVRGPGAGTPLGVRAQVDARLFKSTRAFASLLRRGAAHERAREPGNRQQVQRGP